MSVLIICDYYLPGSRSGGPASSIFGLSKLFLEFDISCQIYTRNTDWKDKNKYTEFESNLWEHTPYGLVYYSSRIYRLLLVLIRKNPKTIILNSVFSRLTILTLLYYVIFRRFSMINNLILYPRGELNNEAISDSKIKLIYLKYFFKPIIKILSVKLIATSHRERMDLACFDIEIAAELPNLPRLNNGLIKNSFSRSIDLLFVGRLDPIKGLKEFISSLPAIGTVNLDVVGPIGDRWYHAELLKLVNSLNEEHLKVRFLGYRDWLALTKIYDEYNYIVLPSFTENYGHSLIEAMSYGLVPIISKGVPYSMTVEKLDSGFTFDHESIKEDLLNIFEQVSLLTEEQFKLKQAINDRVIRNAIKITKEDTISFYELHN